ncbi:MAG TPA: hypothetical protein P5031_07205, partial [Candidatus Syntrophosphaera sp.]|nr:hypothetical protein [Candidatus Syntrophosphaera sp.]
DAGVERGTSMDASNISCSPYSQARCTPGSPTLEGKSTHLEYSLTSLNIERRFDQSMENEKQAHV